MGQDQSVPDVDDFTPPQRLASRNLDGVAQYIKEGKARRIVVMVSTFAVQHTLMFFTKLCRQAQA